MKRWFKMNTVSYKIGGSVLNNFQMKTNKNEDFNMTGILFRV